MGWKNCESTTHVKKVEIMADTQVSAFVAYNQAKPKKNKKKKDQNKQILQWMKGEDDAKLEEEYKLLKKSISSTGAKKSQQAFSTSENKRKRKRMEVGGGSGATSSKSSSDSNDSDQGKRSRKNTPEDYVEILDGDDVPLVEEVVEEMLDDEGNDALEVNGDNFMHTVMKMNKAQEIISNGKTEPKKSASNKKKKIVENGIGISHVDEEMVKRKRK